MAMPAGALELLIYANMSRLSDDMRQARTTVDTAMGGIRSAIGVAQTAFGALGIALSVNYFRTMITNSISAQAEMFNLSQKIGTSVEDLTGLAFAAKQSDIDMGTLEKGLRNLIIEIGKANDGSKESANKFKAMGVELKNSNGDANTLTNILGQMAGYFSALPDGIGKTNAAIGVLGARYGTEFIPLLNETESAFYDLTERGREFSGMTTASAAAAEKLGDDMDVLKAKMTGVTNDLTNLLVPAINYVATSLIETGKSIGTGFGMITTTIGDTIDVVVEKKNNLDFSDFPGITNLAAEMRNAATEAGKLAVASDDVAEDFEEMNYKAQGFVGPLQGMQKISEETIKLRDSVYSVIGALNDEMTALGLSERENFIWVQQKKAGELATTQETLAIRALAGAVYDEKDARNQAAEESRLQAAAVQEAAQLRIAAEKEAADKARENWQRTHEYLTTTFIDIFNNGKNAFDNIARAFKSMIERMVAEWLASGLMGMMSGQGLGGFTTSGTQGITSVLSSIFGGGSAGTPGSAAFVGPLQQGAPAAGGVLGTIGAGISTAASTVWGGVTGTVSAIGGGLSAAGSAVMGALQAIPGWGWALAGLGLAANALDSGGTYSHNAGFLLQPVAGDQSRYFDVPEFDSGFDPIGFNRRTSVQEATAVIDTFRAYDSALTGLARGAGMTVDYSNAPFNGYDEKGFGQGLFYGSAEEDDGRSGTALNLQLNQYVSDWIKALGGQIDPSLRQQALSAGNADDMVAVLAGALGIDGSHASGLSFVPFDNYRAKLHKGERVQTAVEARNSDESVVHLKAIRSAFQNLYSEMVDMKKYMRELYLINDQWNGDGLPAERV